MSEKKRTNNELIAILDGRETGRVARDAHGRLSFTYNEDWRTAENAYPLSISMPLALAQHGNDKIDPFLWGLLPDNEIVLGQWGRKFHVSARNAFSLIGAVGEDCAGAVQFVQPERLETILGQEPPEIEWLDKPGLRCACAPCARITPRGAFPATPVSSVLLAHSRKPRFSSKTEDGASLQAASRRRTF